MASRSSRSGVEESRSGSIEYVPGGRAAKWASPMTSWTDSGVGVVVVFAWARAVVRTLDAVLFAAVVAPDSRSERSPHPAPTATTTRTIPSAMRFVIDPPRTRILPDQGRRVRYRSAARQLCLRAGHVPRRERSRVPTPQAPAITAKSPDVADDEAPASILAEHGCLHCHPL